MYTTKIAKNASFELDFCIICYLWLWNEPMKYIQNATYMAISLHFIRKIVNRVTAIQSGKFEYPRLKTCTSTKGSPVGVGYVIAYRDTDGHTYRWWTMGGDLVFCEDFIRRLAKKCEPILPGISSCLELHDGHTCQCDCQSICHRFGDDIGKRIIQAWDATYDELDSLRYDKPRTT